MRGGGERGTAAAVTSRFRRGGQARRGSPESPCAPDGRAGRRFPFSGWPRAAVEGGGAADRTGRCNGSPARSRWARRGGGERGGYSHSEVVYEALPSRGPLQEVVDPALDAAATQQGLAEAVDGDAGVEADGRPRAVGVHHHHLAPQAQRPLPLRLRAAARRRLPALGSGEWGVVGVGGALGQLQRRGLLAGRHAAFPGQRQPAQAPAFVLARGGAGGHGWGSSGRPGGAVVSGLRCPRELRTGAELPLPPPPLARPPRGRLLAGKGEEKPRWGRARPGLRSRYRPPGGAARRGGPGPAGHELRYLREGAGASPQVHPGTSPQGPAR